ncbi:serine/threonine-protein kinase gin4 [Saxophila tyrrhenica]|uniref:non-specific serine/threonine protein kinase n=1 Tax=Saxophila tyrrhenica TaxID=1690608 RepID=A0AAV9PMW6_9PEZI|nr:serine/threonine-protein kinase gin4 [Saxophila tyrrhenica]
MADRYRHNRQPGTRQPLGELRNQANTPPVQQRRARPSKAVSTSPQNLPHNESLEPNGSLAIRGSNPSSPEYKRISQIASEEQPRESKRNSAISTTSTNASATGRKRKTYIGQWQLGKTIGKGGCSRVRVVRHKTRHQYGAVKIITRATAENTRAQSLANLIESTKSSMSSASGHRPIPYGLEREIAVMKLLEHPNIVRLFDVWENRNELYLIMEYVDGGELFHYVDERKGLPEDETVYIFRQIVSALLYCHRLLICHRDLKPENILLNRENLTVKLIDFGMAALQPAGRQLSTPCGSPHYAAPEVVSSRPYDGTQADVWSCGVILYVMLTGTTPYNYSEEGDIRVLFRDIAKADYHLPPGLGAEAKDLISRIFVPDPKKRITMDGVWEHALLHKYDRQFGYDGRMGSKEAAIGPIPTLTDFKVNRIQDIDREILRNMRTLWHSEPERSLVQKLLNNDINQEKLFYAALVKHRDENLENYSGPDDMDYSNSDYHHNQAPKHLDVPPVPVPAGRSQSQYSILNDEHLRPAESFVNSPPSVSSYDPYRASKDPIVNGRGEYVNVTVHRNGSRGTLQASVTRSLRHQNALRIEVMKQGGRRASNLSSSSLAHSANSKGSVRRSSASDHSMTSSMWPSSPPMIAKMRPSDRHKRQVSFGHLRRSSITSGLVSQTSEKTPPTPSIPDTLRDRRTLRPANPQPPSSSPVAPVHQPVRSKKEKHAVLETPRIKVRKPAETPSQNMRRDIRKHSAELEKACEEAFFRSSVGSSLTAQSTFSEKNGPFDTPPSSVSRGGSGTFEQIKPKSVARPLPDVPKDTPNTYLTKTLAETREKLAAYQSSGDDNTAKFEEVMKMLETIMPGSRLVDEKRTTSAPETKTGGHPNFLPVISEESDQRSQRQGTSNWQRSVTAPVQKDSRPVDKTIRVVPPSPSGFVAPLNVRKQSNGSEASSGPNRTLSVKTSADRLSSRHADAQAGGLEVIDEDTTLTATPAVLRKKRSGWFGLGKKVTNQDSKPSPSETPSSFQEIDDRQQRRPSRVLSKPPPEKATSEEPPLSAQSSEFPTRKDKLSGAKKGLSRWLGKKSGDKAEEEASAAEPTFTNRSLDSLFSAASPVPSSDDSPPSTGPERSWFARFFHIKPAVKVVCFSIPRGRARQELVILLREWQRHGVQDLQYSRETNTITASVGKHNALDIKPVSFRIELFVVLEHGRKVGLSIARFVQTKGAASGFKRVIEVVDGVMRGRGWLVEDEEKWRALSEVVGG